MAQSADLPSSALVPMGQIATTLGVAPGTATTMVKTLADSGLVRYEPYAGVRLTRTGEKQAARVLRRHRLIEQFLVQIMGMSWTEVHEEAEKLEHAVSERLIERIDEMLGRPAVDPHGDPIPDADGTVNRIRYDTLLTCPLAYSRHGATRQRSGSRVPPLRGAPRSPAGTGDAGRGAERRRRQRAVAQWEEPALYDRRARRVQGAGPGRGRAGLDVDAGVPGARPDARAGRPAGGGAPGG